MSRGVYDGVTIKIKGGPDNPTETEVSPTNPDETVYKVNLKDRELYVMQAENQPPRLFVGTSNSGAKEITTMFKLNEGQYGPDVPTEEGVEGQIFFKIATPENVVTETSE